MFGLARSIRYLRHGIFTRCVSVRYNSTKHNFFLSLRNNTVVPTKRYNISWAASPVRPDFHVIDHRLQQLEKYFNESKMVPVIAVMQILQHIQQTGHIDSLQVLRVLQYCGNSMFESAPHQRVDLAKQLWDFTVMYNVPVDITHYNTLLKIYLENNYDFDPIKFLTEINYRRISPNKDTYQHFIEYYCKKGDINATVKVLESMKDEDIPLNETIFNLLILGHSEAGDVKSAMQVLDMMEENNIEPTSDTYAMIMQVHAKQNDMSSIRKILNQTSLNFMNKNIYDVMYAFIKNRNMQSVNELLSYLNQMEPFSIDDANFIGKLIDIKETNIALNHLLNSVTRVQNGGYRKVLMRSFLRRLLNSNVDTNVVGRTCLFLENSNVFKIAFFSAIQHAIKTCDENVILCLLRFLKKTTYEIRTHYFWPVFCRYAHKHNFQGILDTIDCMKNEFDLTPCFDTIKLFILPYNIKDIKVIRTQLINYGIPTETIDNAIIYHFLSSYRMRLSVKHMETYDNAYRCELLKDILVTTTYRCNDVVSFVNIIKMLTDEVVGSHQFCSVTECLKHLMLIQPPNKVLLLRIVEQLERNNVVVEPMILDAIRTYLGDVGIKMTNISFCPRAELTLETQVNKYFNEMTKKLDLKQFSDVCDIQTEMLLLICKHKQMDCFVNTIKRMEALNCLQPGVLRIIINFFCGKGDITNAKKYTYSLLYSGEIIRVDHHSLLRQYIRLLLQKHAFDDLLELFKKLIATTSIQWFRDFFNVLVKTSSKIEIRIYLMAVKKILGTSIEGEKLIIPTNIKLGDLAEAVLNFALFSKNGLGSTSGNIIMSALINAKNHVLMNKFMEICFLYHDKQSTLLNFLKTYLEHDKLKEASILLKRYDMSINSDLIQRFIYKSIFINEANNVKKYLTLIHHLDYSEKKLIYEYVLHVCYMKNDWSLASEIWTCMQKENIVPSKAILNEFTNLSTITGQPVPFNLEESLSDKSNTNEVST